MLPAPELVVGNEAAQHRPAARDALPSDSRARTGARAALALLVGLLAVWVAWYFLLAVAWAGAIAITVWPIYTRFSFVTSDRRAPALPVMLFPVLTGLVLVVPTVVALHQIAQGSEAFIRWLAHLEEVGIPVPDWVVRLPLAGQYLDHWWQSKLSDPKAIVEWLGGINIHGITAWVSTLGGALLHRSFLFLISLVTLFFLFRDGGWLADRLLATIDRLLGDSGERLASRVADAIRGTANGTIAVAILKGLVIGGAYVLAGVPHLLLFMALTIIFAILPFGAWVVFTVAGLVLPFHGADLLVAASLFVSSATVMLIGDHFLQPALIGGAARLPFLLVLFGILGGNSIVRAGRPIPRSGSHMRSSRCGENGSRQSTTPHHARSIKKGSTDANSSNRAA
jgi:predicted PurR-regulated permease PerM